MMLVILHRFSSDEDSGIRLKGGADYKRKDITVNRFIYLFKLRPFLFQAAYDSSQVSNIESDNSQNVGLEAELI